MCASSYGSFMKTFTIRNHKINTTEIQTGYNCGFIDNSAVILASIAVKSYSKY